MGLGISRWWVPLSFVLCFSLFRSVTCLLSSGAQAQSAAPPPTPSMSALLTMFPQLKQNPAAVAAATAGQPIPPAGMRSSVAPRLVPYDEAMKTLQDRVATFPKPLDVSTIAPTVKAPALPLPQIFVPVQGGKQ
jgi:hypothetical protein